MTTKRNFTKGEVISIKIEHVDAFYDTIIVREKEKIKILRIIIAGFLIFFFFNQLYHQ